jgi:hypothetical protein
MRLLRSSSIRQHTSAYVSIRQHTSAYVSICRSSALLQPPFLRAPRAIALVYEALSYYCMGPEVTSVWGLKLLVSEAVPRSTQSHSTS